MSAETLFLIFDWLWVASVALSIVANEVEVLRGCQKTISQLKWLFLGGAVFYSIWFLSQPG